MEALQETLKRTVDEHAPNCFYMIYACSPEVSSFTEMFTDIRLTECVWKDLDGQKPDEEKKLFYKQEICGHLRIDTHGDNITMQHLVKKLGFVQCGTIYVEEDNYPRLAFEKIRDSMAFHM